MNVCFSILDLTSIHISFFLRHITLSPMACLAVLYCLTLSQKRYYFRRKYIQHKICVLISFLQTFSEKKIIFLIRIQRDNIINLHRSLSKVSFILERFWKIYQMQNILICPFANLWIRRLLPWKLKIGARHVARPPGTKKRHQHPKGRRGCPLSCATETWDPGLSPRLGRCSGRSPSHPGPSTAPVSQSG